MPALLSYSRAPEPTIGFCTAHGLLYEFQVFFRQEFPYCFSIHSAVIYSFLWSLLFYYEFPISLSI